MNIPDDRAEKEPEWVDLHESSPRRPSRGREAIVSRVNVGDVSGPRWVGGVTNPDSRDAEVEALRAENETLREIEDRLSGWIVQLAAERDVLAVENEKLRGRRVKERVGLVSRIRDYRAERDALQAQLDNMTERVEYAVKVGTWPPTLYQDAKTARYYASHPFSGNEKYEHTVVTRRTLTGAWTAVEGGN